MTMTIAPPMYRFGTVQVCPDLQFLAPRPQAPRRPAALRQRQILAAAVEVVADEGLAALRVAEVARRSGIAKTTVYLYYATRQQLILETVRQIAADHLGPLTERSREEPAHMRLPAFLRGLCIAARHPAVRAVFAGGPAPVAAESTPAGELVRAAVAGLVSQLEQLASAAGGDPRLAALAPVLVGGVFVCTAWSDSPSCDGFLGALTGSD
jgi:AcrR family transcriptional regulator